MVGWTPNRYCCKPDSHVSDPGVSETDARYGYIIKYSTATNQNKSKLLESCWDDF